MVVNKKTRILGNETSKFAVEVWAADNPSMKTKESDYRVLERRGPIHVLRQPPPEAQNASPGTRLRELVESMLPGR